jgi:uncharacterized membrane protein YvbJ
MIRCPYCEGKIQDDAKVCKYCKSDLRENQTKSPTFNNLSKENHSQPKKEGPCIATVFLVIGSLLVGVNILFFLINLFSGVTNFNFLLRDSMTVITFVLGCFFVLVGMLARK